MPPLREVRNRIRSVRNISQITRALEAVSASRVRRAQARALASRAFAEKAWEILLNVQNYSTEAASLHPLLQSREEVKKVMVVLITSDRGLAGSYNANIIRVADRFAQRLGKPVEYVAIGRKGRDSLVRNNANIVAEFSDMPPEPRIADISPIARLAKDAFISGEVDEVLVAYTDFVNMLTQRPTVLGWLPLTTDTIADQVAAEYVKEVPMVSSGALEYDYEPNAAAVLDEIVPRFTELMLYQALLEAQASEHAARMSAMRNATDNASQLVADLTLEYNKARQAAITSEILDIVGGANALQDAIDAATAKIESVEPVVVPNFAEGFSGVAAQPRAASIKPGKAGKPDDLTKIEGIGPKMSAALVKAGLETFQKVADASEAELRAAIEAAGMSFSPSLTTWSQQAALAARGDWDGLRSLQDELNAGRR